MDESDEVDAKSTASASDSEEFDTLDASGVTGNGPEAIISPSMPSAHPSSVPWGSPGTWTASASTAAPPMHRGSPGTSPAAATPADEPQMPSRISGSEPP